jgi:hypothetical protein
MGTEQLTIWEGCNQTPQFSCLRHQKRALKNYLLLSDYTPAYRRQGFQKNDSTEFSEISGLFQKSQKRILNPIKLTG